MLWLRRARFGRRALDTVMANAAFEKLDCSAIKIEFKDDQHFKRRNPDEVRRWFENQGIMAIGLLV